MTYLRRSLRTDLWDRTRSSFPVNMPDPNRKRFGHGQLWPLLPAWSPNRAGLYMPDLISLFRFGSVFVCFFSPKKAQTLLCKTYPDLIWMALSGFSQTHRVRKQAGVQESSGLVSGRTSPISHFQTRMRSSTDGPHHLVQNHPGSDLLLADCQVLAKRIRPGSKLP